MEKSCVKEVKKGIFEGIIESNCQIGHCFWRVGVVLDGAAAKAFSTAKPGQFCELDLSTLSLPDVREIPEELADAAKREVLLRRPFSFCDIEANGDKCRLEILYCVLGPGTLRMTTLQQRDTLSIIGPLGNGFWVPDGKKRALLVAGGTGTPPLQHLAKVLKAENPGMEVIAFAGAKTKEDLPFDKTDGQLGEFAKYDVKSIIATDDGSAGFAGFVTEALEKWIDKNGAGAETVIYACGPEAMMAATSKVAGEHNIDCQVSMEKMMACGIGLCQSCAVACKANGEMEYKLCCKDGPIFDSKEILWNE